jgi:hypothetical protein
MSDQNLLVRKLRTLKQENHDRMVLYIDVSPEDFTGQFPDLSVKKIWQILQAEMLEGDRICPPSQNRKNVSKTIRYYVDNLSPERKPAAKSAK